jgi:integrase
MLETERSSDEALRAPTFRRLYLGALAIENEERRLKACYIILLAGRLGLRTGEIQHARAEWIDWDRGEIAIPRHDPCGCKYCWLSAKQKAITHKENSEEQLKKVAEKQYPNASGDDIKELVERLSLDEESPPEEDDNSENEEQKERRTAEEILYEERWQPKYERSARRVPFGHSRRLTAVVMEFVRQEEYMSITQPAMINHVREAAENADGVDPEAITIRGLRATAATNYATYIRNPKVLQDLMGWTRLETIRSSLMAVKGELTRFNLCA